MFTHNQRVKTLIDELEDDLVHATHRQHLIAIIRKVQRFGIRLEYNNTMAYVFAVFFALLAVFFCNNLLHLKETVPFNPTEKSGNTLFMVLSIAAVFFVLKFYRNYFNLDHFSDQIFHKNVAFDNGLKSADHFTDINRWKSGFKEFTRGTFRTRFPYFLEGSYQGQQRSFSFALFDCESISYDTSDKAKNMQSYFSLLAIFVLFSIKETFRIPRLGYWSWGVGRNSYLISDPDPLPDQKGFAEPEHRFGLIVPFRHIRNIAILSTAVPDIYGTIENGTSKIFLDILGEIYQTEHAEFNDNFNVYAASQLEIARILTPRFIELIMQLVPEFTELNFEFNHDGMLCISFKNDDLLELKHTFGLDQPELFILEINDMTVSEKLQKLLMCLEQMKICSD